MDDLAQKHCQCQTSPHHNITLRCSGGDARDLNSNSLWHPRWTSGIPLLLVPGGAPPRSSMATALQRQRAMHLYRHSLKAIISWAVRREIFYEEVSSRCETAIGKCWQNGGIAKRTACAGRPRQGRIRTAQV